MIRKMNILVPSVVALAALAVIAADPGEKRPAESRQAESASSTAAGGAGAQKLAAAGSNTRLIPFQGRLTDLSDNPVADGGYGLVLSLYDAADSGTLLWTETQSGVAVKDGRFSVVLGSLTSLDDPDGDPQTDDAVSFDQPRYLGIAVDPPGEDPLGDEMTPRKEIVPAIHAHEAGNAQTLGGLLPGELMPVGAVLPYAGDISTPPTGWLVCDGTAYSSTDYAALYAAIGTAWGGDVGSTFRVPDLRGRFVRGVDGGTGRDPDVGLRTFDYPGGQGQERYKVGSVQGDATALPTLDFTTQTGGPHLHTTDETGGHHHSFDVWDGVGAGWGRPKDGRDYVVASATTSSAGAHSHEIPESGSHGHDITGGDNETRPINAYVHWIIKYR